MKTLFCFVALSLCANGRIFSQNPDSSRYIEVIYIKSASADFERMVKETWKLSNRQLISDGKKSGWYFYRIKYPRGEKADYDYVVVNAFHDWNLLTSSNDYSIEKGVVIWKQLFRMMGMAVGHESKPSKYLIANEVKTVAGQEGEYVKMEQTYFKPFHTARAAEGIMNNWGLYKREIPYGEKFTSDYVTFNGYATWEDITKQNPPTAWKTAHGNLNFNV